VLDFCTDPNSPSARHLPTPGHSHAPPAEGHAAPHDPVELLRDQVSFVLEQYHDPAVRSLLGREVEIVLRVESGGGGVQDFGVAADAVRRIRDAASTATAFPASVPTVVVDQTAADATPAGDAAATDIVLTVCVDRIAASGGYMVAAQATPGRLFAAPFALVGSIGVYTERVNIHDALTRLGVRGMVLKAGKSKAPIGAIGEVRDSDVSAVQDDLDRVHDAFRSLVKDSRKVGDEENLSEVMEGECFLGQYAQELGLVDRTITSDAYIAERVQAGDKVLRLRRYDKPRAFGGLTLPLSPLDLLLSGGASEDLFGKLKSKVRASISSVDLGDGAKFVGIIVGALALFKDFQLSGDQNTRPTVGPQVRYREDKYSYN
jgi:serine protease SohB